MVVGRHCNSFLVLLWVVGRAAVAFDQIRVPLPSESELLPRRNVPTRLSTKESPTMSLETVKNVARVPLNLLLMVVLLPVLVIEYIIGGLTLLASIGSLLQCEDKGLALKFITAYQSGALVKTKFPNSIAVRS